MRWFLVVVATKTVQRLQGRPNNAPEGPPNATITVGVGGYGDLEQHLLTQSLSIVDKDPSVPVLWCVQPGKEQGWVFQDSPTFLSPTSGT
jgi:hypothetical protein